MPVRLIASLLLLSVHALFPAEPQTFRVVTYNVENYLEEAEEGRPAKTEASRAAVAEALLGVRPHLVALQEMGTTNAFQDLKERLLKKNPSLTNALYMTGADPHIHLAVLTSVPILSHTYHVKDRYVLQGRPHAVSRGILEATLDVHGKKLTLFDIHLKSRRAALDADQAEVRYQEALIVRRKIEEVLKEDPSRGIIVLGDFNDTHDSPPVTWIVGNTREKLIDLRPGEQEGGKGGGGPKSGSKGSSRRITWTHYFGREDTFSRVDYILVTKNLRQAVDESQTFVQAWPGWGEASDHRPVVATFRF